MIDVFFKKIIKFVIFLLAMILTWIVVNGIFNYKTVLYSFNPIILIIGLIIYIIFIVFVYKKIISFIYRFKFIEYILMFMFSFFCIVSALYFKVSPSWDMGTVLEIAVECLDTGKYMNTFYLSRFPNNIMMTLVDIILLLPFKYIFVKPDYLTIITIISALVIALSIVLMFFIVKKIANREKGILFLIICCLTTPFYMYAAEYYTDTFSMLVSTLLFFLWIFGKNILLQNKKYILKIVFTIIYGIVLFFGIKLKITSSFVFIAIFLFELSNLKYNVKKYVYLKFLFLISIVAFICIILFNIYVEPFWAKENLREQNEIPIEHWIMMGMNGVGTFSFDEYAYTLSFEGFENRKKADIDKIKERIKTRSIFEHFKNINLKLGFAWHDGTYWGPDVIRRKPYKSRRLHEYILKDGNKNYYYKYFPQVMHFSMLIFIIINIINKLKKKIYTTEDNITLITMFVILIFFIIWENRSRYLVTILPMMIMNQIEGIDCLTNKIKKKNKARRLRENY